MRSATWSVEVLSGLDHENGVAGAFQPCCRVRLGKLAVYASRCCDVVAACSRWLQAHYCVKLSEQAEADVSEGPSLFSHHSDAYITITVPEYRQSWTHTPLPHSQSLEPRPAPQKSRDPCHLSWARVCHFPQTPTTYIVRVLISHMALTHRQVVDEDVYQRQGDNIITWCEAPPLAGASHGGVGNVGVDLALSFQVSDTVKSGHGTETGLMGTE